MPKVVLIASYFNRDNMIDETLQGIAQQTYRDFEAYVYDDGSTDCTFERLKRHESDSIHIIKKSNSGMVRTFIDAIGSTESEYIAIQGPGDYSYPERLAQQVAYMDANPDCAVVGCYSEIVSDKTEYNKIDVKADVITQLYEENPFVHGEVLMRRSMYEKCGGYRSFFTYRQDLDLWLRIAEHGRLHVIPEVLYRSPKAPNSVSLDANKLFVAMTCREFAVYCSKERRAGRPDPLSKRGAVSALVRPRSRELAEKLCSRARFFALQGKSVEAEVLLNASFNEYKTVPALVTKAILFNPGLMAFYLSLSKMRNKKANS